MYDSCKQVKKQTLFANTVIVFIEKSMNNGVQQNFKAQNR